MKLQNREYKSLQLEEPRKITKKLGRSRRDTVKNENVKQGQVDDFTTVVWTSPFIEQNKKKILNLSSQNSRRRKQEVEIEEKGKIEKSVKLVEEQRGACGDQDPNVRREHYNQMTCMT